MILVRELGNYTVFRIGCRNVTVRKGLTKLVDCSARNGRTIETKTFEPWQCLEGLEPGIRDFGVVESQRFESCQSLEVP